MTFGRPEASNSEARKAKCAPQPRKSWLAGCAALLFVAALVVAPRLRAQSQASAPSAAAPQAAKEQPANGRIFGVVKSGSTPLPGATVFAIDFQTRKRYTTLTDAKGEYLFTGLGYGQYIVAAQMMAFAPGRNFAMLDAKNPRVRVDMDMVLMSRMPAGGGAFFGGAPGRTRQGEGGQTGRPGARPGGNPGGQGGMPGAIGGAGTSGLPSDLEAQLQSAMGGAENGGEMSGAAVGDTSENATAASGAGGVQGGGSDAATQSVAVSGNINNGMMRGMSSADIQARVREFQQERMFGGGFGGPGGFRGGRGGGGGFFVMRGGGRGFDEPHGALFYTLGDSGMDAAPYSLTGGPGTKASFIQHRFGATLGGPLNIPKIYKGGTKNFFFFNYTGSLASNPFDQFSTVPTLNERQGIFSGVTIPSGPNAGQPVQIFDPTTGQQFSMNTIPSGMITSQAQALLAYIPKPNLPGTLQNFHYVTSVTDNSNNLNFRLIHNFGAAPTGFRMFRGPRNSLNVGFHYSGSNYQITNPFPTVAGSTTTRDFDISAGYVRSMGKLTNIFNFDFNRSRVKTQNIYAFVTDVAGLAGVGGVSQNPFDYGVPGLQFTDFSGLNDISPNLTQNQTFSFSDSMVITHGKHTLRWGGDFRRIQLNPETDTNARGSFTFTGLNTAEVVGGVPVSGTGFDFADFLLGLPQSTSVQYGQNNYHFRGNSWDLYAQDDWRLRGNFTANFGVRYEYVSPYSESNNYLANLDVAPGFTAVAPVLPGQIGPYTGAFPVTLINPDRNNIAPRIGIAWRAAKATVVRAGYGINYNTGAYASLAQQMAFQPPFDVTQTNIESATTPLTLANGFPAPSPSTITNNFAVDRNFRLGYVQIWNLDVQQELSSSLLLNVDYTGTKGTALEILEAPNRTPTGLRIPGVQPFNFETSAGDSVLHAGTIRMRKRLSGGVSVGGTYTYSKSIDNASSIGGGASTVAQNAFDLAAERGLSNFDQTNRFTGDFLWDIPAGHDRRWLVQPGVMRAVFGDWELSGDWTVSTGLPFTANILGNFSEVNRGTNGTLRADSTGQPVALSSPTTTEWFNTGAFAEPATGQFGDVGRNTIRGPGSVEFNMAMTKVVPFGEMRMLEIRAQATNVFNHPNYSGIDTTLGTTAFGQVTSVGGMRTIEIVSRFRF